MDINIGNQDVAVHGFFHQMEHFLTDMSNRELGLRQTQALINTYHIILIPQHCHVIHHLSIHWKVGSLSSKLIIDE